MPQQVEAEFKIKANAPPHIYENLRKYFRREVIYENLCRGCGYGVFAAQGPYCQFCECLVRGKLPSATATPTPCSTDEDNIYENICELCRGIYSDNEPCRCQTPTPAPTPPPPAAGKTKSRTLLNYSKSSAASLTRFFGSLKQLNRSSSLQRRLFQRDTHKINGAATSLEIIHNVDEVFRTQETFDMQRMCELKQAWQSSQSDQHIYGRVRREIEVKDSSRKKPRISRMRLLQAPESESESLYLNESICQWMNGLRQELHPYDEGLGVSQQPKSVPPTRELELDKAVVLRKDMQVQDLVEQFKRKLQVKQQTTVDERRRCGINEHHDADFVTEFLSGLPAAAPLATERELEPVALVLTPSFSLWQLMQSAALAASLHASIRGFIGIYDKSVSDWLRRRRQHSYRWRAASESESASAAAGPMRRRLLPLPPVVPATPVSDDVIAGPPHDNALVYPDDNRSLTRRVRVSLTSHSSMAAPPRNNATHHSDDSESRELPPTPTPSTNNNNNAEVNHSNGNKIHAFFLHFLFYVVHLIGN